MDKDLKAALQAYAKAIGRPMTEVTAHALTLYLGRRVLEAREGWEGRPSELGPETVAEFKAVAAIALPSYAEGHVLEWAPIEVGADGRARIAALQHKIVR